MTREQLDAIRARVEAAPKVGDTYIDENGDEVRIVETVEDADFFALLAEVERLTAEVVRAEEHFRRVTKQLVEERDRRSCRACLGDGEKLEGLPPFTARVVCSLCWGSGSEKYPNKGPQETKVERDEAFQRGVAAMREAARLYFVGKAGEAFAEHDDAEERRQLRNAKVIRTLPDPEDRP